jgi:hypothetical protein
LTEEVLAFLEEEVKRDEEIEPATLAERVRDRFGCTLHPRTIGRGLARRKKKPR